MDPATSVGVLLVAAVAGLLGSMVGLGGGVFIVPILSVFFGIPLKTAIAASALSVVVNSLSGTTVYLRHRITNVRLGLFLLITTVLGAIAGGLLAVHASPNVLRAIFALSLYGMSIAMLRRGGRGKVAVGNEPNRLGMAGSYFDPASQSEVSYVPRRLLFGMTISSAAGVISGMFGIGGGAIQVPVMNAIMRVPVKAAAATSVFIVGTTVVASAIIYYLNDLIDPGVAVPAVLGVVLGSQAGAQLARRLQSVFLARLLVAILLYLATTVLLQALGIHVPGAR